MRSTLFAMAFAAATLLISAVPAAASSETCDTAPARLRAIAATADADAQRKAGRNIDLGELLCKARNKSDAAKKFSLAAKALGTDLASVMSGNSTAAVQ